MPADPAIFNPTSEKAAAVLADLDSPDLSFRGLAHKHGTNSDALAAWLAGPASQRVEQNLDTFALRARTVAASCLHSAVGALSLILENYTHEVSPKVAPLSRAVSSSTPEAVSIPDPADMDRRRRRDETTRRAAYLVFRIANFWPPHSPPSPRSSPSPHLLPGRRGEVPSLRGDEGSGSNRNDAPSTNSPLSRAPRTDCGAGFQPASGAGLANSTPLAAPVPTVVSQPKVNAAVPARDAASRHAATRAAAPDPASTIPSLLSAPSAPSAFSAISGFSARDSSHPPRKRANPSTLLSRAGACVGAAP